jgi:hypothetical protein
MIVYIELLSSSRRYLFHLLIETSFAFYGTWTFISIINKAIMGSSTQQFFFSPSDVIATTCFGHTTIIQRHTVVYCLKLLAWL